MPGPKKRSNYNYTRFDVTTIPDMSAFVIFGLLKDQLSKEDKELKEDKKLNKDKKKLDHKIKPGRNSIV